MRVIAAVGLHLYHCASMHCTRAWLVGRICVHLIGIFVNHFFSLCEAGGMTVSIGMRWRRISHIRWLRFQLHWILGNIRLLVLCYRLLIGSFIFLLLFLFRLVC